MAASTFFQKQEKYDYLQFVVPDIYNIPRGKIVQGKFKEQVAKNGLNVNSVIHCHVHGSEIPVPVTDLRGRRCPNVSVQPCLETLTPWPWVGKEGRRVGNVLCDIVMPDGTPDLSFPRQLMKAQLGRLWEQHQLVFKSAFEYEFNIFKAGTLEPLGGKRHLLWGISVWNQHQDLFCDLADILQDMGIHVSALMPEISPGQWEITAEPEEGVRGGDVGFYVMNAVKGFFQTRGYQATFLGMPTTEHVGAGQHLNHSLWTKAGDEMKSVMLDTGDPDLLSSTARHWLAGILAHAPALTALCCPTLNCYRSLAHPTMPGKIYWGLEDRRALVRVRTAHDNVFLENRLPSGPCNPYLAIAATVAAGLDGINRQLPCPRPTDVDQKAELPKTMAEALDALEKDEQLCSLLGDRFVDGYIRRKKAYELQPFDTDVLDTGEKQMEFERNLYMETLQL